MFDFICLWQLFVGEKASFLIAFNFIVKWITLELYYWEIKIAQLNKKFNQNLGLCFHENEKKSITKEIVS